MRNPFSGKEQLIIVVRKLRAHFGFNLVWGIMPLGLIIFGRKFLVVDLHRRGKHQVKGNDFTRGDLGWRCTFRMA